MTPNSKTTLIIKNLYKYANCFINKKLYGMNGETYMTLYFIAYFYVTNANDTLITNSVKFSHRVTRDCIVMFKMLRSANTEKLLFYKG